MFDNGYKEFLNDVEVSQLYRTKMMDESFNSQIQQIRSSNIQSPYKVNIHQRDSSKIVLKKARIPLNIGKRSKTA